MLNAITKIKLGTRAAVCLDRLAPCLSHVHRETFISSFICTRTRVRGRSTIMNNPTEQVYSRLPSSCISKLKTRPWENHGITDCLASSFYKPYETRSFQSHGIHQSRFKRPVPSIYRTKHGRISHGI